MKMVTCFMFFIFIDQAYGLDFQVLEELIEKKEVSELIRGHSLHKLNEDRLGAQKLRITLSACKIEYKNQFLPIHCYQLLTSLFDSASGGTNVTLDTQFLDRACEGSARVTKSMDEDSLNLLPTKCSELAKRKIQINKYKAGIDIEL